MRVRVGGATVDGKQARQANRGKVEGHGERLMMTSEQMVGSQ